MSASVTLKRYNTGQTDAKLKELVQCRQGKGCMCGAKGHKRPHQGQLPRFARIASQDPPPPHLGMLSKGAQQHFWGGIQALKCARPEHMNHQATRAWSTPISTQHYLWPFG